MSLSQEEIDEIARAVVRFTEEARLAEEAAKSPLTRFWGWIKKNPTFVAATAISGVVLVFAHFAYDAGPETILGEVARDYRQAQERNDLVATHLELGRKFLGVQNLRAARVEFREALTFEPTNPDAQQGLFIANIYEPIVSNEYDVEVVDTRLNFLNAEDPENPFLLMILGDVATDNDQLDEALTNYDDALAKRVLPHAHAGKAEVYSRQGKTREAIREFRLAVELSPGNARYRQNLGNLFYETKRYGNALEQFSTALRYDPTLIPAHLDSAVLIRIRGGTANAVDHDREAVGLLANKRTAESELNGRNWTYTLTQAVPTAGTGHPPFVTLTKRREKRYYAYVQLALTLHLRGAKREASAQLARAKRLHLSPSEVRRVHRIVVDDIKLLESAQPKWAQRFATFRSLLDAGQH